MEARNILFCICVVTLLSGASVDAWGASINVRVWNKRTTCSKICGRTCKKSNLEDDKFHCFFGCLRKCKGKNIDAKTRDGHLSPMPIDFNVYDIKGDGAFDKTDFATVFGDDPRDSGLLDTFNAADKNGDGRITFQEFRYAPWIWEGQELRKAFKSGAAVPPPKCDRSGRKQLRSCTDT